MALEHITLNGIVGNDYTVTFTYDDGKTSKQTINIASAPDADFLMVMLTTYFADWYRGMMAVPTPDPSVAALIGKPQVVSASAEA